MPLPYTAHDYIQPAEREILTDLLAGKSLRLLAEECATAYDRSEWHDGETPPGFTPDHFADALRAIASRHHITPTELAMMLQHAVPIDDMAGKRVNIYRSLHAERSTPGEHQYSVRDVATGWVVGAARYLLLSHVEMHVQPAGRGKVILTGQKNVHAYIAGVVVAHGSMAINYAPWAQGDDAVAVTYNPFLHAHFFRRDTGARVDRATFALATPHGVLVYAPQPPKQDCTAAP